MIDKKVLIYFNEESLAPKGGPAAVCYYYQQEQIKRGEHQFDFLPSENQRNESPKSKRESLKFIAELHSLGAALKMMFVKPGKVKYNLSDYDLVHFHSSDVLYQARTSLESYKGIVLLQSHSPEPRGREMFAALPKWIRTLFPFIKKGYERMDRYAFERANYLIFPCSEAEEPYIHVWPYYRTIQQKKAASYRYVLTGIPDAKAKRNRSLVLEELKMPADAFVISYVGRHNEIKGYDLFKEIGKKYLEIDKDAWVICAGKEHPLHGLDHHHWKEIGWTTEPHSYIGASDVFVLPNRETYFDIIMMELLSLGKIVIASNTGGNKWFAKHNCPGVFLYDTVEDAVELLRKVRSLSVEEKTKLEEGNKIFYNNYLTVSKMYDSYVELLRDILG